MSPTRSTFFDEATPSSSTNTTPDPAQIAINASANMDILRIAAVNQCTNANFLLSADNLTTTEMSLSCAGNLVAANNVTSTSGNIIAKSQGSAAGEIVTGNGGAVAGPLGSDSIVVGTTGIVSAATTCAVSASNAGAATLTNGYSCKITTGSANTASTFTLTYANAFNTAPECLVEAGTTTANLFHECTPSTASVTVTFYNISGTATAPGNSQAFYVFLSGGK